MKKYCKDCIYCPVCSLEDSYVNNCSNFKDKSTFIELPCPIGTTLYRIGQYVRPCSLYQTYKNKAYCRDLHNCPNLTNNKCDSNIEYHIIELPSANALNILMSQKDFGTRVFLTREDAQKKLEELNNG